MHITCTYMQLYRTDHNASAGSGSTPPSHALSLAAALSTMSKPATKVALGRGIPTLPEGLVERMLACDYIDLVDLPLARASVSKEVLSSSAPDPIYQDTNYRQHMAETGQKDWSKVDPSIYSRYLMGWSRPNSWCEWCVSLDHNSPFGIDRDASCYIIWLMSPLGRQGPTCR